MPPTSSSALSATTSASSSLPEVAAAPDPDRLDAPARQPNRAQIGLLVNDDLCCRAGERQGF